MKWEKTKIRLDFLDQIRRHCAPYIFMIKVFHISRLANIFFRKQIDIKIKVSPLEEGAIDFVQQPAKGVPYEKFN